jgi:predicted AlkP superfamily phosphohydrolase/phosphomutase
MKARVIIIGLDGATFDLINPWIKNGTLKNLKKLIQEGCSGTLESTMIPTTWPGWVCFSTGKNPGKIGAYDFENLKLSSYDVYYVYDPDLIHPFLNHYPVWALLKGKKSIVINVPGSFPQKGFEGVMISGIFTPDGCDHIYPRDLASEIERAIGNYRIDLEDYQMNEEKFQREIFNITDKRFKIASYLMKNKPWDFFLIVFTGPDRMQHKFWKYVDSKHPLYNKKCRKHRNTLKEYWMFLDEIIETLRRNLSSRDHLLVVSDHGHGRLSGVFNLNDWLVKEGYLKLKVSKVKKVRSAITLICKTLKENRCLQKMTWLLLSITPAFFRNHLISIFSVKKGISIRSLIASKSIDWRNTKAFGVGTYGKIYVNAKSKRPEGAVNLGSEYEELVREIEIKLRSLERYGRKLNVKVYRGNKIYKGKFVDNAPDLIPVIEDFEFDIRTDLTGELFTDLPSSQVKFSSAHRTNGILIISGPYIKQGRIIGAKLIDVAPTILHLMGFPIPKDVDGRVLKEIFKEGSEPDMRNPQYQEAEMVLSQREEERLK